MAARLHQSHLDRGSRPCDLVSRAVRADTARARSSPAYRLLDPSRWIALCFAFMNKRAVPDPGVQGEVLVRLESAFDAEIGENCARIARRRVQGY